MGTREDTRGLSSGVMLETSSSANAHEREIGLRDSEGYVVVLPGHVRSGK